jgi:transposase-like protein
VPKPIRVTDTDDSPKSEHPLRGLNDSHLDVETVPKRSRRVFSAADKLRIVREADRCLASGERGALGAMLRREGLYSSLVSSWRTQLGVNGSAGLEAKKAGRKPKFTEAERLNAQLLKRNAELERKLHIANVLIALQKKAHELLGIALPESDEEG